MGAVDQASLGASPFFIVGTGRCGSTLFQAMLCGHGGVRIPPESQYFLHLDPAVYGIESPIDDSSVDRYIECVRANRTLAGLGHEVGLIDEYLEMVKGGLRGASEQFVWLIDRASREQGGDMLGEKTPAHWMKIERIVSLFPEAKIVHIHRDPRAVCEALLRMDWWHNKSLTWTAGYCRRTLEACRRWERRLGEDRMMRVSFERLIDEPEGELGRVCAFLGIGFEAGMLESAGEGSSADSFSPRVRPADRSRLGLYMERLSGREIAVIKRVVGGGLMGAYGYECEASGVDRVLSMPCVVGGRIGNRARKYGGEIGKLFSGVKKGKAAESEGVAS